MEEQIIAYFLSGHTATECVMEYLSHRIYAVALLQVENIIRAELRQRTLDSKALAGVHTVLTALVQSTAEEIRTELTPEGMAGLSFSVPRQNLTEEEWASLLSADSSVCVPDKPEDVEDKHGPYCTHFIEGTDEGAVRLYCGLHKGHADLTTHRPTRCVFGRVV